ncbi:DUF4838 domain-containing protein [Streptomyces sp. NPDC087270]|uniref:DUF4838 domain-containing protein n=1 Tax=Streptomyces sp. NPDC087270 TaxID=3365774 RepID=UPI00382C677E
MHRPQPSRRSVVGMSAALAASSTLAGQLLNASAASASSPGPGDSAGPGGSAGPAAAGCRVGRGGRAQGHVVWWAASGTSQAGPPASSPVAFAAAELARYLGRVIGGSVPVVRLANPSGTAPYGLAFVRGQVPTADVLAAASRDAEALSSQPEDSWTVTTGTDFSVLTGAGERACLFAAYGLLRQAGVEFFAPTFTFYQGAAESVPRSPDLVLGSGTTHRLPQWALRRKYVEEGWSINTGALVALVDWMAKQGLNTLVFPYDYGGFGSTRYDDFRTALAPEIARRGLELEVGGHGYQSFLPQSTYPQYYTSGTNVFDVQNGAAVDQYVHNVLDYLTTRPEIGIFDCWPPDSAVWPKAALTAYGTAGNAETVVVNAVVAALRDAAPGVRVERIAYGAAIDPPTGGHSFDPDVIVDFAPYGRTYSAALDDPSSTTNAGYLALLRQWRDAHEGPLAVYDYSRRYRWRQLPANVLPVLARDAAVYRSLGLSGIGCYAEPADWLSAEAVHLFAAHSAWDPALDDGQFLGAYLPARFGASAAAMADYFARTTADPDQLGSAAPSFRDSYTAARADLDSARRAVPAGSPRRLVLDRLDQAAEISLADVAISLAASGTAAERTEAADRYEQLTLRHRFDGVQLDCSYVASRYGEDRDRVAIAHEYRAPAWGYADPSRLALPAGGTAVLTVHAQDVDYRGHRVQWRLTLPEGVTADRTSGVLEAHGERQGAVAVRLDAGPVPATGDRSIVVAFSSSGTELTSVTCTLTT